MEEKVESVVEGDEGEEAHSEMSLDDDHGDGDDDFDEDDYGSDYDSQDEYEVDFASLADSTESEDDGVEVEEQTRNNVKYVLHVFHL